jgi:hypothetical protein
MWNAHRVSAGLAVAMSLSAAHPHAQFPSTVSASYERARAALDLAIAAHGGPDALHAARRIRLTLDGHDLWRNQSRNVEPP